jgi:heme a synthase
MKSQPAVHVNRKISKFQMSIRLLIAATAGLMALGAGVRTLRAGLSCPDWPLCFGKVIPDFHVGVWFEFVHRAYAGLVAIGFLVILVYIILKVRQGFLQPRFLWIALLGLGFLSAQIIMGALTVLLLVKAYIVTAHLILATCFLLTLVALDFFETQRREVELKVETRDSILSKYQTTLKIIYIMSPILVMAQLILGGLVASTYSGAVCVDWPLCRGQWVPTWEGAIGLQVMHRFLGYTVAAWIFSTSAFICSDSRWRIPPL